MITLVLVNGRVRTNDPRRPVADALAITGSVLALVGSSAEVRKLATGGARVVDLRRASVLPLPAEAVLRRGAPASFVVMAPPPEAQEMMRVVNGAVVVRDTA